MKVVKRVTGNCIINSDGKVIFYRKNKNSKKEVVLNTIEDALSQNFHILENLFLDVVQVYDSTFVQTGEISAARDVLSELEEKINHMASGLRPEKVDLSYLVEDFRESKNEHKKRIFQILNQDNPEISDLAQAHLSTVNRIKELQGIIVGTINQTRKLIEIRNDCEQKIIYAHNVLAEYESKLSGINSESDDLRLVSKAVNDIAGEGANKVVFALNSVTRVNPYRERVESREVKKLSKLPDLLEKWKREEVNLEDIIIRISSARSKLKRIVRKVNNFKMKNHWR